MPASWQCMQNRYFAEQFHWVLLKQRPHQGHVMYVYISTSQSLVAFLLDSLNWLMHVHGGHFEYDLYFTLILSVISNCLSFWTEESMSTDLYMSTDPLHWYSQCRSCRAYTQNTAAMGSSLINLYSPQAHHSAWWHSFRVFSINFLPPCLSPNLLLFIHLIRFEFYIIS